MTEPADLLAGVSVEGNYLDRIAKLEQTVKDLQQREVETDSLDRISDDLGEQHTGEFRAGVEETSGEGFTGVRVVYPAAEYDYNGTKNFCVVAVANDVAQAGFTAEGEIVARVGEIADFSMNGKDLTAGSGTAFVGISSDPAKPLIWGGSVNPGDAPFSVTKAGHLHSTDANIGGFVIDATSIHSENYAAGVAGMSLSKTGRAELQDGVFRGAIRGAVMEIEKIMGYAGTLGVFKSAGVLMANAVTAAISAEFDIDVEDNGTSLFEDGDILRIKSSPSVDIWMTIQGHTSDPEVIIGGTRYTVKMESGSVGVTLNKGESVFDYGEEGSGYLVATALDSTEGEGPFYSVRVHHGEPWEPGDATNGVDEYWRAGKLIGYRDLYPEEVYPDYDIYGWAAGNKNSYFTWDTINGARQKGSFELVGQFVAKGLGYNVTFEAENEGETRHGQMGTLLPAGSSIPSFGIRYFDPNPGNLVEDGDFEAENIATNWVRSTDWQKFGDANSQVSAVVYDGSGAVYVGGGFTCIGGGTLIMANRIAKYTIATDTWSPLGSGIDHTCFAIAVSGTNVYVGGYFSTAGGSPANNIAKWNGSAWSALGSGLNDTCYALAVSGSDVYAGGEFTTAGGSAVNYIAKWNGSTSAWSALGNGLDNLCMTLVVSGSDIYAGGFFTYAGGGSSNRIAKWNGSAWSALGSGLNDACRAITVSGSDVYAGGQFTTAGGNAANCIGKWNGSASAWSALGSGLNGSCHALVVSGSGVYAGGQFTTAGGSAVNYIAKWNGSAWSALGTGLSNYCGAIAIAGNDLYVGGGFSTATSLPCGRIARYKTVWTPTDNEYAGTYAAFYNGSVGGTLTSAAFIEVDGNATYNATIAAYGRTFTVKVAWYDDTTPTHQLLSTTTIITGTLAAAYSIFSGTVISPVNAKHAKLIVTATGNSGTLYVDNLTFSKLSIANMYLSDGKVSVDVDLYGLSGFSVGSDAASYNPADGEIKTKGDVYIGRDASANAKQIFNSKAIGVSVYNSAPQTPSTGVWTDLTWNHETDTYNHSGSDSDDTDAMWTSGSHLVAKSAGWYMAGGGCEWDSGSSTEARVGLRVLLNGSVILAQQHKKYVAADYNPSDAIVTGMFYMHVDDYVTVQVLSISANNYPVQAASTVDVYKNHGWLVRLA